MRECLCALISNPNKFYPSCFARIRRQQKQRQHEKQKIYRKNDVIKNITQPETRKNMEIISNVT